MKELKVYKSDSGYRILDTDLGERLGLADPRKIRELIKQHSEKLSRISVLYEARKTSGEQGGRPATEYYLDRKQAAFIVMKSETENAFDVQMEVIQVFDAYLQGTLPSQRPAQYIADLVDRHEEARAAVCAARTAFEQASDTLSLAMHKEEGLQTELKHLKALLEDSRALPYQAPPPRPAFYFENLLKNELAIIKQVTGQEAIPIPT